MRFQALAIYTATLLGLFCHPASSAELPDIINRIRPSIVVVGTVIPLQRPSAQFKGAGFVLATAVGW